MPRPRTPAVPRKSHQSDFSVLASVTLKTSPTAFMLITMLTWLQGCAYPLWPMWFSVYASLILLCSRVPQSKPPATLRRMRNTRYGWLVRPYETQSLDSSRSGLSPEKKRQASLVAPPKKLINTVCYIRCQSVLTLTSRIWRPRKSGAWHTSPTRGRTEVHASH